MKLRLFTMLLVIAALFAGCSDGTAGQQLESVKNTVEQGLDAVEDRVENAVTDALTPATEVHRETTPATETHNSTESTANATTAATLTKEEAEQIALDHAGLKADQVTYLHTEYEIDNGVPQYEVEFHHDTWEYDYEIHAETGEILAYDKEK